MQEGLGTIFGDLFFFFGFLPFLLIALLRPASGFTSDYGEGVFSCLNDVKDRRREGRKA